MKRTILVSAISLLFLTFFAINAFADYVTLAWSQERSPADLKGWRIYYAVHPDADVPDPPVSKTSYDVMIDLVAFDTAGNPQTPLPQIDLPPGMKVYPYPGYEDTYWEVTYRFYLPSFPLQEKKQYYLAATCYDLVGNESILSNIINFHVNPPGLAGVAVLDGNPPEASGASEGSAGILFSIFKKSDSTDSNVPSNLSIRSME
jgi:hypothetical protein